MNTKIRKAALGDIQSIYDLNKQCLPIYYSYLEHAMLLLSSSYLILVVERKNKIIGYMIGEFNDKNFHILSIGIDNKFRSKGIGSLFIKELIKFIKEKCDNITLIVHVENTKGISFYEKNGFNETEHLVDYYQGSLKAKSQDALKMKTIF